jgi:hypothetical protein
MNQPFARKPESIGVAIGVILIHLAVSLVHGLAHSHLGIGLNAAQEIFVGVVITAAPLVAGYLLWKNKTRAGGALLAASMAGALVFGVYFHFIAAGIDNVNHEFPFGPASWKNLFDETAFAIAGLEVLGAVLGLVLVLKSYKRTSGAPASIANRGI